MCPLLIQLNPGSTNCLAIISDFGCYYHESFLRGIPEITCLIRRLPSGIGKTLPSKETEPDFYRMSQDFPLPDKTKSKESANLGVAKCKPRVEGEGGGAARKNEIAKRPAPSLQPPPTASSEKRSKPSEVSTQPREISTTTSKKMSLLERARADADNAFTQGYVPDYHVLVNSVPKVERTAAQIQAQTSAAVSQGFKVRPASLAGAPQPVSAIPGDADIAFAQGYVPDYQVLVNSVQARMSPAINQEQAFALGSAFLAGPPQPVSLMPGNLFVDMHGRVVWFGGINYPRVAPLSGTQMQGMIGRAPLLASAGSDVRSSQQLAHPFAAASLSRGSTDGPIPYHVKMHLSRSG